MEDTQHSPPGKGCLRSSLLLLRARQLHVGRDLLHKPPKVLLTNLHLCTSACKRTSEHARLGWRGA